MDQPIPITKSLKEWAAEISMQQRSAPIPQTRQEIEHFSELSNPDSIHEIAFGSASLITVPGIQNIQVTAKQLHDAFEGITSNQNETQLMSHNNVNVTNKTTSTSNHLQPSTVVGRITQLQQSNPTNNSSSSIVTVAQHFGIHSIQPDVTAVPAARYPPYLKPAKMMEDFINKHRQAESDRVQTKILMASDISGKKRINKNKQSTKTTIEVQERRDLIRDAWSKKIIAGLRVTKEVAEKIADQIGLRTAKKIPQVKAVLNYHRLKNKSASLYGDPDKNEAGHGTENILLPDGSLVYGSSSSSSSSSTSSSSSSSSSSSTTSSTSTNEAASRKRQRPTSTATATTQSKSSLYIQDVPFSNPAARKKKAKKTKTTKNKSNSTSSSTSSSSSSSFAASDRKTHNHIKKKAIIHMTIDPKSGKKMPRKQRQFLGTFHHVDNRVNGHVVRLDYYKTTGTKTKCYVFNNFDLQEESAAALADVVTDINQCFRQRFNAKRGKGISKRFSRNFGVSGTSGVNTRNRHFQFLLYRFKAPGVSQIFKEAFDTMRKIWSECMVSQGDDYKRWSQTMGKEWISDVHKSALQVLSTFHNDMDDTFGIIVQKEMAKSFASALEPIFDRKGVLLEFQMGIPLSGAPPGNVFGLK